LTCFHCQQSAEKYLKALIQELGLVAPRTHNLEDLLNPLLTHNPRLKTLRRILDSLSRFAVVFRYPGANASKRQAQTALRQAERIRHEMRSQLGLSP
jgi:HEPN domain-containing protein